MTSLRHEIEMLEERANEAQLLGGLACDHEGRLCNRVLAKKLRLEAAALRRQVRTIAA
jgi:hypothetical protein